MTLPRARRLDPSHDDAVRELGRVAFGGVSSDPPEPVSWTAVTRWGVEDARGRLVANATERDQQQWFGGRAVRCSGIASVAVAAEARGGGVARAVMQAALGEARERGAVVSTLFRTAPALYRSLGYEQTGLLCTWAVPTEALSSVRVPEGITLRAADPHDPGDIDAVRRVYREVARAGNGYLEREGPLFDWPRILARHSGTTLAVDGDGVVQGYCAWQRGAGYDEKSRLEARDLLALTGPAGRGLLAMLGSWASVTGTIVLRVPAHDPVHFELPRAGIRPEAAVPWMLAVIDGPGAVAARGWPPHVRGTVDLDFVGDRVLGAFAGSPTWRLVLEGGEARLEPGGSGATRLHVRGLSVLYAGGADPALLRRAGLLEGGSEADDALLAAAFAGPAPATNDYF
ncbi:putative acetyltransferase [Motilibacter peucedani]|uniref:Putative acetyltransferase n=1 Tax=Motilibacter peucedani TaxID=598650 RepID=A0A420XS64_9ACTN|nr:GNAT family N-acetyltransferase [Motilibacter peucedani]RKS77647.1 putative acetyltransferase [Motilibacter peucedani]